MIARLQIHPSRRANAGRSTSRDQVTGLKSDEPGEKGDDGGDREDHLPGASILLDLAIHRESDRESLRIAHTLSREHARADRAKSIVPFSMQPVEEFVALASLAARVGRELAVGDVVHH